MADIYDGHDDQRTADLGPTAADRRPSTDSKKPQPIHRPYQKARDDRPKSEEQIQMEKRHLLGQSQLGERPEERLEDIPELIFRELRACDRQQLVELHEECFPVRYESAFYDKATTGKLYSCAAFVPHRRVEAGRSAHASRDFHDDAPAQPGTPKWLQGQCRGTPRPTANGGAAPHHDPSCEWSAGALSDGNLSSVTSTASGGLPPAEEKMAPRAPAEELAAVIISQISPQGDFEDAVLHDRNPRHKVAYICTLGVWPKFRRHKLAARLLDHLLAHVAQDDAVKAVTLHVLDENEVACHFYQAKGFMRLCALVNFYTISNRPCTALLYAAYRHGGRPPRTLSIALERLLLLARDYARAACREMLALPSCFASRVRRVGSADGFDAKTHDHARNSRAKDS